MITDKKRISEIKRLYYLKNKEKIQAQHKKWYEENKQKAIDSAKKYYKYKRDTDNIFKFKDNVGALIKSSLKIKGFKKPSKTEYILGCSLEQFKKHIESKFNEFMSWDNYGLYNGSPNYGWDIDHIIPISSAKTIEDVIRLSHYTNLQPLCSYINRYVKRDR